MSLPDLSSCTMWIMHAQAILESSVRQTPQTRTAGKPLICYVMIMIKFAHGYFTQRSVVAWRSIACFNAHVAVILSRYSLDKLYFDALAIFETFMPKKNIWTEQQCTVAWNNHWQMSHNFILAQFKLLKFCVWLNLCCCDAKNGLSACAAQIMQLIWSAGDRRQVSAQFLGTFAQNPQW